MLARISDSVSVNLQAVSSINVVSDKQVFNLSYSKTFKGKIISDFVYLDLSATAYRKTEYFKKNFIKIRGRDRTVFLNVTQIAQFLKSFEGPNPKLIINFLNSVELQTQLPKIIIVPEYMYISFNTDAELHEAFERLNKFIETY